MRKSLNLNKPENYVDLEEEIPRVLESINPIAPRSLVTFNYGMGGFELAPSAPPTIPLFRMESAAVPKSLPEALNDADNFGDLGSVSALTIKGGKRSSIENDDDNVVASPERETELQEGSKSLEVDEMAPKEIETEEVASVNHLAVAPIREKKTQNAFNFCETSTQTAFQTDKSSDSQTAPVPRAEFNFFISPSIIYDAYAADFERLQREKTLLATDQLQKVSKDRAEEVLIGSKMTSADLADRVVNQTIFDDISQDFSYYEDAADEFRTSGSLLPLWSFRHHKLAVNDMDWNCSYHDLLGVAYGAGDVDSWDEPGYVILFTLKNPSFPTFQRKTNAGALSIAFNPQIHHLLAVGFYNGQIAVYDVTENGKSPLYVSDYKLSHNQGVSGVQWQVSDVNCDQTFYSVSYDGTVKRWVMSSVGLQGVTILTLILSEVMMGPGGVMAAVSGYGNTIKLDPIDKGTYRVGSVTGRMRTCSTEHSEPILSALPHYLTVTSIDHNIYCPRIFLTASEDWTIKIWDCRREEALFHFDVEDPVVDARWSPYTSTVFAALTADGFIHFFDLNIDCWRPVCRQGVVSTSQGKEPKKLVFMKKAPVVAVGDSQGSITLLKLSPNLRQPSRASKKKVIEPWELEVRKLETILSFTKPKTVKKRTDVLICEV